MITKPETLAQAAEWERTKNRYLGHGLCERCAAQAAWAHQNLGDCWSTIHPPVRTLCPDRRHVPLSDAQSRLA